MQFKKHFAVMSVVIFSLLIVFLTVATASPWRLFGDGGWFEPPCDLRVALVDSAVVGMGIDPYAIWSGSVIVSGYKPGYSATIQDESLYNESDDIVCVNTPWIYAAILPLTFLPWRVAAAVHFGIMVMSLGVLAFVGVRLARKYGLDRDESIFASVASILAISMPLLQDFSSANWALIVIAASVMMAFFLERGANIAAGVCWAIAMIKPHVGLIFAVPLLMRCRIKTCVVAVLTCLLATLVSAIMTHTSPITLIMNSFAPNQGYFWGCGTMPSIVCGLVPTNVAIFGGLIVGAIVCIWLTRKMLATNDEFLIIAPAAICSMCWTYARCYSHVASWFFFIWLCIALKRSKFAVRYVVLGVIALFSLTRLYNVMHSLHLYMGVSVLQGMTWLDTYFEAIDTLNSTFDLILAACLFCFIIRDKLVNSQEVSCNG